MMKKYSYPAYKGECHIKEDMQMAKEYVVTGYKAVEGSRYVTVLERSKGPMGGLLGFILGTLISLLIIDQISADWFIGIVVTCTLLGYLFSDEKSSKDIPKNHIIRIIRKYNYVEVHYLVPEHPHYMNPPLNERL